MLIEEVESIQSEDEEQLPAFQRSRQINDIFTGVQNCLPDMEFSDLEDDSDQEVDIVTRQTRPIVSNIQPNGQTNLDTSNDESVGEEENGEGDVVDDNQQVVINGNIEKAITELSVHSFIDTLVGQLAERPSMTKGNSYHLEGNIDDLDLDEVITMLQTTPAFSHDLLQEESDDISISSDSTIVMDELERLAETYDTETYEEGETSRDLLSANHNTGSVPRDLLSTNHNTAPVPRVEPVSRYSDTAPLLDRPPVPTLAAATTNFDTDNFRGSPTPEPDTIVLDLRPQTPDTPARSPGRIIPHHLTKKLVHPPSSDSDEEKEKEVWADMRKKVKSTGTSPPRPPTNTSHVTTTATAGVTTLSTGGHVTTACAGTTTQPTTKKSTCSMGVSTQNSTTGPVSRDTQQPPPPSGKPTNTFSAGSGDFERAQQISRYQAATNTKHNQIQRKGNKKVSFDEPHDNNTTEKADREKEIRESGREKTELQHKIRTAWSENNNKNNATDNRITQLNDNKDSYIVDNRVEERLAEESRKRKAAVKLREKRQVFKKRLEETRAYSGKHLIYDIDESFTDSVTDTPHSVTDTPHSSNTADLLMLELMVDTQGELSSLPPEYYAYCYNEIPTVSAYGIEGIVTWLLTSSTLPFLVLSSRLTFINNCLSYIFLIQCKNVSTSGTFYDDISQYLSTFSVARSDPDLFSNTILNPRDYPFCETLNKILLLSEYKHNKQALFSAQPACVTHCLVPDKVNEVSNSKTKHRLSLPDLQDQVSPVSNTEFCVTTLSGPILSSQRGLFHVLTSVRDAQLEIAALRLVYEQTHTQTHTQTNTQTQFPKLCLVITGYSAISTWADKLGPVDERLALRTDPDSVRAVLCKMGHCEVALTNTRSVDKTRLEMARYFGYKFTDTTTTTIEEITYPLVFERAYDHFFLLVSPLISPSLLGDILTILQHNGVSLLGIRRSRLNYRKCVGIGLSECQTKVFSKFNGTPLTSPSLSSSSGSTPSEDRSFFPHNFSTDACPNQPTLASTILFLSKRNGLHHSRSLIKQLKCRVVDENVAHTMQETPDLSHEQLSDPYLYFEMIPYSENNLWNVGGPFGLVPERKTFDFFMSHKQNPLSDKSDLEQTVFIAMTGKEIVSRAGHEISDLIHYAKALDIRCEKMESGYLELLGVKLIPKLTSFQARELTQYEVGDPHWKSDIQHLQTVPVVALLVRAINAFRIVGKVLEKKKSHSTIRASKPRVDKIMSDTPEHAYKLASLLFFEKELYSDEILRPKQLHLPPPRTHVNSIIGKEGRSPLAQLPERLVYQSEGILKSMLSPPRLLATVLITEQIKHFGKILKRLEQEEFSLVGLHLTTEDQLVICVQAENSIYKLQQLLGPDNLKEAKENHQFSLRANFSTNENSFYGSPTYNDSVADIKIYFPQGLSCPNTLDLQAEGIPHSYVDELADANLQKQRFYTAKPCYLRPLLQTVCVVFPPDLLKCAKHTRLSPASQIITLIQSCQFEVMNSRLVTLAPTQIYHLRNMFKYPLHTEVWQTFANRASLVLALQRENAASCFMQILQGYANAHNKKLLDTYGHLILVSPNKNMAEQHLTYFFDFLSGRCKDEISPKI